MNASPFTSFAKNFDFKLASRWLLLGGIVGIVSGLAAILFQTLLDIVSHFSFSALMGLDPGSPGGEHTVIEFPLRSFAPWMVVLLPLAGGLLVGFLIQKFAPEAEGHGTDEVIKAYHEKRGIVKPIVPIIKLFASVLTIGTGGSGGREGPIAQIGSGFGSFLAMRFGMNTKTRRWLLAAGMGAGIGSMFHAPLAGALFAAEVLYSDPEVEAEVLLPATVSSIIAYSIFSMVFGWQHMFVSAEAFLFSNPLELFPYLILAIVMAGAAFLYTKTFYGVHDLFKRLKINPMLKPAIGGMVTGLIALMLIFYFDDQKFVIDVMGSGYGILQEVFDNGISNVGLIVLVAVGLGKILTTSFSISSGGSAGVFGPSMVIGGSLGAAVGFSMQMLFPDLVTHPTTYAIVGMAAFFAAAANTPLSTIIMVSELTGNYELLLPSMWVCTISYFVARKWTIYKSQVPNHNYSQAHFGHFAPDILSTTTIAEAFRKSRKFTCIDENAPMEQVFDIVDKSRQRIYPVTDANNHLKGVFTIDDVTHVLHEINPGEKSIKDIMYPVNLLVTIDEPILTAYRLMTDYFAEEVLVVDENREKVLGIITSADIILTYNRKLTNIKMGTTATDSLPQEGSLDSVLTLDDLLEKDLVSLKPGAKLGEIVKAIIQSKRNIFPVVDDQRHLKGIVLLNNVREKMFDKDQYDVLTVESFMEKVPDFVYYDDSIKKILKKFEKTGAWNLPVIDRNKHYMGFVSKSSIFSAYRNALIKLSDF